MEVLVSSHFFDCGSMLSGRQDGTVTKDLLVFTARDIRTGTFGFLVRRELGFHIEGIWHL